MKIKHIIILATPRTGSTIIYDLLSGLKLANCGEHEWGFDYGNIEKKDFDWIRKNAIHPKGFKFSGYKIMPFSFNIINRFYGSIFNFLECKKEEVLFINLRRKDILAQAISLYICEETGYYHKPDANNRLKEDSEISIDIEKIDSSIRRIKDWKRGHDFFFKKNRIRPHIIYYEELMKQGEKYVNSLLLRHSLRDKPLENKLETYLSGMFEKREYPEGFFEKIKQIYLDGKQGVSC